MKNLCLLVGILAVSCLMDACAQSCPSCFPADNPVGPIRPPEQKEFAAVIYSPHSNALFIYGQGGSFQGGSDESVASAEWAYTYSWTSNRDGSLSTRKFFTRKNLSYGEHVITFSVTKTNYNLTIKKTASASVNVKVDAAAIEAKIVSPQPEGVYLEGESIRFSALVSGGVAPYRFDWRLSDGTSLGSGNDFAASAATGTNEARLLVTDAQARTAEAITVFDVVAAQEAVFTASIASPAANDSYREGDAVNLIAYASGGSGPYRYSWYLDEERVESIKSVPGGQHVLTLEVSDARGIMQNDSLALEVAGPCDGSGTCDPPRENYGNCPGDCPSGSADGFCDGLRDGSCDRDCGRQKDPDCLCNRNGLCEPDYENYLTCPQDCASGSSDRYCDGVKDNPPRCDPDCMDGRDPDCGTIGNPNYFILLVLVIIILLFYIRFVRR